MKHLFLPLTALALFSACQKDEPYVCDMVVEATHSMNKILPHAYYPAYPGSYWTYNDTHTVAVDAEWQAFTLKQFQPDPKMSRVCGHLQTDEVLLPKIGDYYLNYDQLLESYDPMYNTVKDQLFSSDISWNSFDEGSYEAQGNPQDMRMRKTAPDSSTTIVVNGTTYTNVFTVVEDYYEKADAQSNFVKYKT